MRNKQKYVQTHVNVFIILFSEYVRMWFNNLHDIRISNSSLHIKSNARTK